MREGSHYLRGSFEKFMDSHYSESEFCGGAVTVSFFRSTSLGKRCTSYNATPTSWKRAADRRSLRNFLPLSSLFTVGKAQKSHDARSGLYGGCSNGVPPIHFFQAENTIQFRSCPMRFLGFFNHEKGAQGQEISKRSMICSTFSRSGWSVVRSASLAKGGTSTKGPSPHLHKVPTRSNKVESTNFSNGSRTSDTYSTYIYMPSDRSCQNNDSYPTYLEVSRRMSLVLYPPLTLTCLFNKHC
jgi:hypothetical protein